MQDQWREYKTATLFPGEIESRGKIEKCLEYERPGENLIIIDDELMFLLVDMPVNVESKNKNSVIK